MAEYIEREAYLAELAKGTIITDDSYGMGIMAGIDFAMKKASGQPAADVAPVVHGRFGLKSVSDVTSTFVCSECGREFEIANAYLGKPTEFPSKNYPYCNCGARMDRAE